MYTILQIIVLSYTAITAIFALLSVVIRNTTNRLPTATFGSFSIVSIIFQCAWVILALPYIDTITHTHWITSIEYDERMQDVLKTYLGNFTSEEAKRYFATVLVTTIGMKGSWVLTQIMGALGINRSMPIPWKRQTRRKFVHP